MKVSPMPLLPFSGVSYRATPAFSSPLTIVHGGIKKPLNQSNGLPGELSARLITLNDTFPKPDFTLRKNGVGCIPRGDVTIITGSKKSCKTKFEIGLIVALLVGDYLGFEAEKPDLKIGFVDTEQNSVNTQELLQGVKELCGFDPSERLLVFNLRDDAPQKRSEMINLIAQKVNLDVLFIDGAKDLMETFDINNATDAGKVMQTLMSLTARHNLALITVIHGNKGDDNLRGHIGTELQNKCSEIWQLSKTGNCVDVKQNISRNAPVEGTFSFTLSPEGLPVLYEGPRSEKEAPGKDEEIQNRFMSLLPEGTKLSPAELKKQYISLVGISHSSYDNHRNKMASFLRNDEQGNYFWKHTA